MMRGAGEEVSREARQVLRERYVLFFSAAQEIWKEGVGEREREKERKKEVKKERKRKKEEKGQVKCFPLWLRKWWKVETASSVLKNGLNPVIYTNKYSTG